MAAAGMMTMSNFAQQPASSPASQWFSALISGDGFVANNKYERRPGSEGFRFANVEEQQQEPEEGESEFVASDPLEVFRMEAFEEGRQIGRQEAEAEIAHENAERRRLGVTLRRLDEAMMELLSKQLAEVVAILCEETLAPAALDHTALQKRAEKAVNQLAEGREACVLYLNPADIARLDPEFAAEWSIQADNALQPGDIRVEGQEGGISDGPTNWARVLQEALSAA